MPESLDILENQRAELIRQIARLGDFRSGSITSIRGRCGKPNCHCHQPHHPGHGPNFRLTYKVQGKTVTETFSSPAARRQAERQIAEFHKFRQLSRALIEVNAQICRRRPAEAAPDAERTAEEKKRRKPSSTRSPRK